MDFYQSTDYCPEYLAIFIFIFSSLAKRQSFNSLRSHGHNAIPSVPGKMPSTIRPFKSPRV